MKTRRLSLTGMCTLHSVSCGHATRKYKCRCEPCVAYIRSSSKAYYDRNKAIISVKNKTVFKENRLAYLREYRQRNTDKVLDIARRSSHKRKQDLGTVCPTAVCPVCSVWKKLVWDHDHLTGKFRGWICRQCNAALGLIGDDYSAARNLAAYLQKSYSNF